MWNAINIDTFTQEYVSGRCALEESKKIDSMIKLDISCFFKIKH